MAAPAPLPAQPVVTVVVEDPTEQLLTVVQALTPVDRLPVVSYPDAPTERSTAQLGVLLQTYHPCVLVYQLAPPVAASWDRLVAVRRLTAGLDIPTEIGR